jgi:hypothetical protein
MMIPDASARLSPDGPLDDRVEDGVDRLARHLSGERVVMRKQFDPGVLLEVYECSVVPFTNRHRRQSSGVSGSQKDPIKSDSLALSRQARCLAMAEDA